MARVDKVLRVAVLDIISEITTKYTTVSIKYKLCPNAISKQISVNKLVQRPKKLIEKRMKCITHHVSKQGVC